MQIGSLSLAKALQLQGSVKNKQFLSAAQLGLHKIWFDKEIPMW